MDYDKKVIVFAGPSGVGKSTLAHILLKNSENCEFSISATTRPIRLGELHGTDYYFFTEEQFKNNIQNNLFLEWEEVYPGRFYGTLRSEIERISNNGNIAIFDVDVVGAVNIKKEFGDTAHVIFIKPESIEALSERLRSRGTETEGQIQTRIARFEKELAYENKFDQIIVNRTGDIESAKQEIIELANNYCKKKIIPRS